MRLIKENSSDTVAVKRIVVEQRGENGYAVGFGQPYMWDYHTMKQYPPKDNTLYVDAQGRNFGTDCAVVCDYSLFMKEADQKVKRLEVEKEIKRLEPDATDDWLSQFYTHDLEEMLDEIKERKGIAS